MARIDLRDHLAHVAKHPGMFCLDGRYRSAVAYVEGCNAATGRELLTGLEDWLLERMPPSGLDNVRYEGLIVYRRFPERPGQGWNLTEDEESLLSADLFALIDEFLSQHQCVFEFNAVDV